MKDTLRLFVAAALPDAVKDYLAQQAVQYQSNATRLVPAQNLHLTLHFLGSTPQEALAEIEENITAAALQHTPFQLSLQCLEPGPKPRAPRLVWARFEQSQVFAQLVQDLNQRLSPQPHNIQKPIPHVTIVRFRKDKPVPPALPTVHPQEPITFTVSEIGLWKSELASPHPVYSVVRAFPLG